MFKVEKNNAKIGAYLADLIDQKYESRRAFCRAYISANGEEPTNETINNMSNRLAQIAKGNKAIQTYDLPFFTELLGVSCEQILSAGECSAPLSSRVTNYSIACSRDPKEWEAYINRADKLILNQDEYCKTVLDYALEFGNYDLLKFLMNKKYIWFDSRNDNDYVINFGAGTSIQRRDISFTDYGLQAKLNEEEQLRLNLIALAADHNDLTILEELRARENTQMYYLAHYLSGQHPDFEKSYDERMVRHISKSSDDVLDYFTDEFEIMDIIRYKDGRDAKHIYMFPYISELLDFIIEGKSQFAETALKKVIKHNKSTYKKLSELIVKLKNDEYYSRDYMKDLWVKHCKEELSFSDNGNIISFRGFYTSLVSKTSPDGLITNIAHTTKTSTNPIIKHLIEELNDSYNQIKNLNEHIEEL